jgi:RNA polymerase sigma factor for flagellar operon FliA
MARTNPYVTAKFVAKTPAAPVDMVRVWEQYKKEPSDELRNQLVEFYMPLVRYNAERLHVKLPDEVDVDDLAQAGIFGLLDAIDAFDLHRGVKFETYCSQRIRGAILDELRAMDWVPRLVRSRAHKLNETARALEAEFGRKPTEKELAKRMNLPMIEFNRLRRDASAVSQVSLSRTHYETDSNKDVTELDVLRDPAGRDPVNEAQRADLKDLLTKGLTRAERLILMLYYYEEMTMKEIGSTLDLSESRVSQMHSAILDRLKGQLGNRGPEFHKIH